MNPGSSQSVSAVGWASTSARASVPGAALARFWEARGCPVFFAAGAFWGRYSRLYHVSFPFQRFIEPDPAELSRALHAHGVLAARYPSPARGVASGVYVCPLRGFSIARLGPTYRKHVRRGLAQCEIRPVAPDELAAQGLALNESTLRRQGRRDPELLDRVRWERFVAATQACPEISVTGAFVERRLAAYNVSCREERWVHWLFKASRGEDLDCHVNPALEFTLLTRAAAVPELDVVSAGFLSLGDPPHNQYKEGMGFRLLPHCAAIELHPAARPWLTSAPGVAAASATARLRPRSARWRVFAATARAARATRRSAASAQAGETGPSPCRKA